MIERTSKLKAQGPCGSAVIDFMLKKIRIKIVLAHIDRVLEVLGGVIMVLTFTSAAMTGSAPLVSSASSSLPPCRSFYRSFWCQGLRSPCAFRI
jgi:hypothetical protein